MMVLVMVVIIAQTNTTVIWNNGEDNFYKNDNNDDKNDDGSDEGGNVDGYGDGDDDDNDEDYADSVHDVDDDDACVEGGDKK